MANYDDNKQAHELTVVNGTIDENSLIPVQDTGTNPLGVANPKNIVAIVMIIASCNVQCKSNLGQTG